MLIYDKGVRLRSAFSKLDVRIREQLENRGVEELNVPEIRTSNIEAVNDAVVQARILGAEKIGQPSFSQLAVGKHQRIPFGIVILQWRKGEKKSTDV